MLQLPQDHLRQAGVEVLLRGEDGSHQWMAPNQGKYPIDHPTTFMNRYTSLSRVYRDYDEALLDNRDNARFQLNDVGIRECLDSRMRSVALLNWHIEPEDTKSQSQKDFCNKLEKTVRRIRNFKDYRESMQWAIWFGKYAIMHRWGAEVIDNDSVWMPKGRHQDDYGWRPVHGDKLVFRQARPGMVPGSYEGQMGIRVGWLDHKVGDVINNRWRVEATDYGLAYFLSPAERRLMLVHRHKPQDAAYEDGIRAGSLYGVGIRSVIYWEWVQKQETQAFLMEFLERMAGGIQMWRYPQGNQQAEAKVKEAALNYSSGKEHIMLVPIPTGEAGSQYGVEVIEPGFQGVETIQHLIKDYFNDRVKRYILGQTLSSETGATGMGSGVAEIHMDTLLQIIKSDATNHEETLTEELLGTIIKINVDKKVWHDPGFRPKFVVETEEPDVDKKLEAVAMLMDRKIKFRMKDLYDLVGMAAPTPNDEVNPDMEEKPPEGMAGAMPPNALGKPEKADEDDPLGVKKPGEHPGGEDESARDDNAAASNGHPAEHLQRYARQPFSIPAGWRRR